MAERDCIQQGLQPSPGLLDIAKFLLHKLTLVVEGSNEDSRCILALNSMP